MPGLATRLLTPADMDEAVRLLHAGEVVAFPTETVYGLGANALRVEAVSRIYAAKGRPSDNPLIVHAHHRSQIHQIAREWHSDADRLMNAFWPGPLTLVLPKQAVVPYAVSGGLDTVAVRIPNHPVALRLLAESGLFLAAPSANVSGRPSPTRAEHVWQDLYGRIAAVLDGGPCGCGVESSVVDCTETPFRLLRPGGVTLEALQACVPSLLDGSVAVLPDEVPRSPGMKYQHYSPTADVMVILHDPDLQLLRAKVERAQRAGQRVGAMVVSEHRSLVPAGALVLDMGPRDDLPRIAQSLFHLLREADARRLDAVFVEGLPETALGRTVMNRLRKASGGKIVDAETMQGGDDR